MSEPADFDRLIDRFAQPGEKWGRYAGQDVLPLWVADMDFAAPQPILDALHERVRHGVFGYAQPWPGLVSAVTDGILRDHGWRIEPDWLVWLPGVVSGLNIACRIAGQPGDEVFTATPIYPPFLSAPAYADRRLVTRPMRREGETWHWDRDAVEQAVGQRTALFMLCQPHNPIGRIFDDAELCWLAGLAEQHDFIICSDDIHCGLGFPDERPYRPLTVAAPDIASRTITLMAPSKTWNIASLYCAFAVIPDAALRRRFTQAMRGIVPQPNVLGLAAAEAAYRHGAPWRQALLAYLDGNRQRVQAAVADMPGLATTRPEATYLNWIDCRDSGLDDPAAFFEAAGVGLSDGAPFGMPGFVRLNFGCPRSTLDEALARMQAALTHRAIRTG